MIGRLHAGRRRRRQACGLRERKADEVHVDRGDQIEAPGSSTIVRPAPTRWTVTTVSPVSTPPGYLRGVARRIRCDAACGADNRPACGVDRRRDVDSHDAAQQFLDRVVA